jgi:hypothetical protein
VTATQDYNLFHILDDHSIGLWEKQIDLIMQKHGLISFIVHPDYVAQPKERRTFETLLAHLARLRQEKGVWMTTPGEVNRWWRQRAAMKVVEDGDGFHLEGDGSERARVAYASEKNGRLVFQVQPVEDRAEAFVRSRP